MDHKIFIELTTFWTPYIQRSDLEYEYFLHELALKSYYLDVFYKHYVKELLSILKWEDYAESPFCIYTASGVFLPGEPGGSYFQEMLEKARTAKPRFLSRKEAYVMDVPLLVTDENFFSKDHTKRCEFLSEHFLHAAQLLCAGMNKRKIPFKSEEFMSDLKELLSRPTPEPTPRLPAPDIIQQDWEMIEGRNKRNLERELGK